MFKVGDRVRITDHAMANTRWAAYPPGDYRAIATVTEEPVAGLHYDLWTVKGLPFPLWWGVELEAVPEDRPCIPPPGMSAHATAEGLELAVGLGLIAAPGRHVIPQDDQTRKAAPMYRVLLGYFPGALFLVAQHGMKSDLKHNPDSADPPHWARGKSNDHDDCIIRHMAEQHTDPGYHKAAKAIRALMDLQEYAEKELGWAPGCRSVFTTEESGK